MSISVNSVQVLSQQLPKRIIKYSNKKLKNAIKTAKYGLKMHIKLNLS
jgi:hypothetical protein